MTDVPQIFQPDDPRQGKLGELIGDFDWKQENQFGGKNQGNRYDSSGKLIATGEGVEGEREGNEYGNYTYKEGEVSANEPGAYRSNANRANRGGILNSGINQGRINTIAGRFANQRYWNSKAHTEATQNFGHERQEGQHSYERNVNSTLAENRAAAAQTNQERAAAAAAAKTAEEQRNTGLAAGGVKEPYPGYNAQLKGQVRVRPEPYPGYWARQRGQVKVR